MTLLNITKFLAPNACVPKVSRADTIPTSQLLPRMLRKVTAKPTAASSFSPMRPTLRTDMRPMDMRSRKERMMGAAMVTRAFISARTTAVSMAAADESKCSDGGEATGEASNQQLKRQGEES
jgi:hypothetical protein